jgi:trans-aconitate methyltransferase
MSKSADVVGVKDEKPDYWLNRDFLASARLTYQHDLIIDRVGYLLHPDIAKAASLTSPSSTTNIHPTEPLQILDLGTGNGIWAMRLASSLANISDVRPVHITGLDVSPEMFPNPLSLPPNVTFGTYDFFRPPPTQYLFKFDIIHIRFINPVLWPKPEFRVTAIKNFTAMLKPNGWLQWTEPRVPALAEVTFDSNGNASISEELNEFHALLDSIVPVQTNSRWTASMDKFCMENGYKEAKLEHVPWKRDQLTYENVLIRWNFSEGLSNLLKALPEGKKKEELSRAVERELAAMDSGTRLKTGNYVTVVARKGH